MIFDGINYDNNHTTIQEAVAAIYRRQCDQFNGKATSPWSLAELRPDERDFAWLLEWARCLKSSVASSWLKSWQNVSLPRKGLISGDACIGLLLLLLAAEIGRREAKEGSIWPALSHKRFEQPDTEQLLFVQEQPTAIHKDALEAAAWNFNLRHVFGITGLMNWFDTIYLQFGFTHNGFQHRLAHWLAIGNYSQAISRLMHDSKLYSASFCTLWQALRNYRQNNIKRDHLIQVLRASPWILSEWHDELIEQARARLDLGTTGTEDNEEINMNFLSEPVIRWNPADNPIFACWFCNLAYLDLTSDTYLLKISNQERARLLRQPDGEYATEPVEEINIDCSLPDTVAYLISIEGEIAYSQPLSLWDSGEDLTLFKLPSGDRVADPWENAIHSSSSYVLCISPDLTIYPETERWHISPNNRAHFHLLQSDWSPEVVLLDKGSILWRPILAGRKAPDEPSWATQTTIKIQGKNTGLQLGAAISVQILHPESVEVSSVRCNREPIAFLTCDSGAIAGPIALSPSFMSKRCLEFILGIRFGTEEIRIRRTLENIDVNGVVQYTEDGPVEYREDSIMNAELAKTSIFRIYPPQYSNGEPVSDRKEWAIYEGDNWLDNVHRNSSPISSLAGLGAPLTVRYSAYNNGGKDSLHIAKEVIDPGILAAANVEICESGARQLTLLLTGPIEPDENHSILWWDEDGSLKKFSHTSLTTCDHHTAWRISLPNIVNEPLAIAICYRGERSGAWWGSDWYQKLGVLMDAKPKALAKRIRWFKFPILSDSAYHVMQRFAHDHPASVLKGWLSDSETERLFKWGDTDERWLAAVRSIFSGWIPTRENGNKECLALVGHKKDALLRAARISVHSETCKYISLLRAAQRLQRLDPLLMGHVVEVWLNETFITKRNARRRHERWRHLLGHISDMPPDTLKRNKRALLSRKETLCKQCADTMGVDDNFVKRGLIKPALEMFRDGQTQPIHKRNIAQAISFTPFRKLLAIQIIEEIEPKGDPNGTT